MNKLGWRGGTLSVKGMVSERGTEAGTHMRPMNRLHGSVLCMHARMCVWVQIGAVRQRSYRTNQDGA